MRVTVVICTWNRCELLRQTLDGLTKISVPPDTCWDILVVNNNCSDDTSSVVRTFCGRLEIREVLESRPGLSHARNRALQEVTSAYLVWIDDDVLVDREWLSALVGAVRRHPDVHAFGGLIEPWFVVEPDPVLLEAFPALQGGFCGLDYGSAERYLGPEEPVYGANMAFAVGPLRGLMFNPALGTVQGSGFGGEEEEFLAQLRRRGGEALWVPSMRVRHYVDPQRMTTEYLTKFAYDRGRTFIRLGRPTSEVRLLGVPRWVLRRWIAAYLRQAVLRFTPFRRAALTSLHDYHKYRGMVAESLQKSGGRLAARVRAA